MKAGASLHPKILQRIALIFLIAPFLNVLLTFAFGNLPEHSFATFGFLLKQMTWPDWLWLTLLALSGGLLLISHKSAWLVATLGLLVVVAVNISFLLEAEGSGLFSAGPGVQLGFSIVLVICVFVVLLFTSFPHFDYRQGWFRPRADRFDIRVAVRIVGDEIYVVETESLSLTGCRVRLDRPWGRPDRLRFVEVAFPDCEGVRIKAQVVGAEDLVLRLKFRDFILGQRTDFRSWIEGLDGRPA